MLGHRPRSAPYRTFARRHDRGPHVDRAAFKVARIYVTLAADGKSANFKFTPDEQELKCLTAHDAFVPVPNAWGKQGWTTATLSALTVGELSSALQTAWRHALPSPQKNWQVAGSK